MIDYNDRAWLNFLDEQVWLNLPDSSLKSRNNSQIIFRCPLCGDSKKNRLKKRGYYYRRTGSFHCFNCEASLSGFSFLKAICPHEVFDGIIHNFKVLNFESLKNGKHYIPSITTSTSFEILSPNPSYRYLLDAGWNRPTSLSKEASAHLDERRIPLDKRDMLRSIKDVNGREFILIQYIYDDRTIYHQLDNFNRYDIAGQGSVKYVFPKDEHLNGQSKPVFNISNVDISFPYIFCTEGIYDSLFIKNGVALGGRSLTEYQFRMLNECFPRHKIVLAFDNDFAGVQSSIRHAEKNPDLHFLNAYDLMNAAKVKDLNDFVKVTGRTNIFTNQKILQNLIMSSFMLKMKMKLNG